MLGIFSEAASFSIFLADIFHCYDDKEGVKVVGDLFNQVWKSLSAVLEKSKSWDGAKNSLTELVSTLLDSLAKTTTEQSNDEVIVNFSS